MTVSPEDLAEIHIPYHDSLLSDQSEPFQSQTPLSVRKLLLMKRISVVRP